MNAEIISADAIQLYKKLDIGSAKPTEEERRGIVHHMMDCIEPDEPRFTVSPSQYALCRSGADARLFLHPAPQAFYATRPFQPALFP